MLFSGRMVSKLLNGSSLQMSNRSVLIDISAGFTVFSTTGKFCFSFSATSTRLSETFMSLRNILIFAAK